MDAERHTYPRLSAMSESARRRAAYAMSIYDWCRAHPSGSADDLLSMIAAIEARIDPLRSAA